MRPSGRRRTCATRKGTYLHSPGGVKYLPGDLGAGLDRNLDWGWSEKRIRSSLWGLTIRGISREIIDRAKVSPRKWLPQGRSQSTCRMFEVKDCRSKSSGDRVSCNDKDESRFSGQAKQKRKVGPAYMGK